MHDLWVINLLSNKSARLHLIIHDGDVENLIPMTKAETTNWTEMGKMRRRQMIRHPTWSPSYLLTWTWHNQNPNLITARILMVVILWLSCGVHESELIIHHSEDIECMLFVIVTILNLCQPWQWWYWMCAIHRSDYIEGVPTATVKILNVCYPRQWRYWMCAFRNSYDIECVQSVAVIILNLCHPWQWRYWMCTIHESDDIECVPSVTRACKLFVINIQLTKAKK